jgi:hypothetical protein
MKSELFQLKGKHNKKLNTFKLMIRSLIAINMMIRVFSDEIASWNYTKRIYKYSN